MRDAIAGIALGVALAACSAPAARNDGSPAADPKAPAPMEGVEAYVPLAHVSQVPFIVIQTPSTGDDGFDYYLRDELVKAGFPRGLTRAQLARVYVEAGLADSARHSDDPVAMARLAEVVGPFLKLLVDYEMGVWGSTNYRVELWDARSATLVYAMKGHRTIWWKLPTELGPPIVAALAKWRQDSLVAEKDAAAKAGRSTT